MKVFRAGLADAGATVEAFLRRRLGDASRDHVAKLLRQGRVQIDGRAAARAEVLRGSEEVQVLPKAEGPRPAPLPNRGIRFAVLHEDEHLAVLGKPAGTVMHPGPGHGSDTLLNGLIARFPELAGLGSAREYGLVHRLDRETSGVVVVARSVEGYDGLVKAFSERRVQKEYLALAAGTPDATTGEVAVPVDGKEALTRFEVLETRGPVSLLKLRPVTGRMHQIRIHLAELGCPVLGDGRYGSSRDELTARLYLPRMALHAARIELDHPVSGESLSTEQPLPKDLRRAWKRAGRLS